MSQSKRQRSPFLQGVREAARLRHYSFRTEESYVHWIVRLIRFHNYRHPRDMGKREVTKFLTHLAVERQVSANTQNQALNALNFLYRAVVDRPIGELSGVVRARSPIRLPLVLTQDEVRRLLQCLDNPFWLPACLMYGSGLRLMETVRLRVKDIDFDHRAIVVRRGKGGKDRAVTLPDELIVPLKRHLQSVKLFHDKDLADGFGDVYLPHALSKKYPSGGREWSWQYVFPARRRGIDPRSGIERRHHIDEGAVQKSMKRAVRKAGIEKPAGWPC